MGIRGIAASFSVLLALFLAPGASADGTLDTSFAGTGQLELDAVAQYEENVVDTAIDDQGRILVLEVGTYVPTGYRATFLVRLLPDGTVDQSFSVGDDTYGSGVKAIGRVESLEHYAMAFDSQGRIVLAGRVEVSPNDNDLLLTRLLPDGAFDESFGDQGQAVHDLDAGSYDSLYGIDFDSQERIIGWGGVQPPFTAPRGFVARFTDTGDLDTSFGGTGFVVPFVAASNSTGVSDVEFDENGRLLVAGRRGTVEDFTVVRLNADGAPDTSYGTGGLTSFAFDVGDRQAITALERDSSGRLLLVGRIDEDTGLESQIGVARLLPDGTLDSTYAQGGKDRIEVAPHTDPAAVTLDRVGRLVIAGTATVDNSYAQTNGMLTRIKDDGTLDTSFGQDGFVIESRPDRRFRFESLSIDQQGRFVVGANSETPGLDPSKYLAMSRYTVTYPRPAPTAKCQGKRATIVGTSKRDKLKGTRKRDVIAGLAGNDVIRGLGGNDLICGGAGADRLNGGSGKDKLVGGPGRDRIVGGKGRDRCLAGPGRKQRLIGCERRR